VSAAQEPSGIQVVGDFVYWISNVQAPDLLGRIGHTQELRKAPKAGGPATVVTRCPSTYAFQVEGPPSYELAGNGATLYLLCPRTTGEEPWAQGVHAGANDVVEDTKGPSVSKRHPLLGVTDAHFLYVFGTNSQRAVWSTKAAPLSWMGTAGFEGPVSVPPFYPRPANFQGDACGGYWGRGTEGFVIVAFGLNRPFIVHPGVSSARRVALDGDALYWADGRGAIGRMPLP
jgi:hypothetical protein